MPRRQSVPRIHVDLLDNSSRCLPPSSTFDIKDILIELWPNLLAEDFDDTDDFPWLEEGRVASFPVGHPPPFFILHPHRTRLPFPIRPEALEMGDFCGDEEVAFPLLTAPTTPRMKLMMKEQLYVQKWVDTLTSDSPPKHIPWSCEKPVAERKWIAEGSIFPADMVRFSIDQRTANQKRKLHTATSVSPTHASTESHTASVPDVSVKSAGVNPGILRGESKTLRILHNIVKISEVPSSPRSFSSGQPTGATSNTPDAPLAARRGKSLDTLKLKESVIEQLEYPDIPTAFRGSPSVWSPRFDALPVPSFTDHQSMLLNLKSRCATLGSGVSRYDQEESLRPWPGITRALLSADKWMFTGELATFDNIPGSVDNGFSEEITTDTSIFLPGDFLMPVRDAGRTPCPGIVPHLRPKPALQTPAKRTSNPPGVPLPPRPALVNSSSPSHVRGILKKVKKVRFEDMIVIKESLVSPSQTPDRHSPRHSAVLSGRPCTPMPNTAKSLGGPALVKEITTTERNTEKKPIARSRPLPKRTRAHCKLEPVHSNVGSIPGAPKSTAATTSVERPCRLAHVRRNSGPITVLQVQAKYKGSSITSTDERKGIEGAAKSRLSTPLRNIFRIR